MTKYLGQAIAIEADTRKATKRKLTDAYHALQAKDAFEGIVGEYQPLVDGAEQLPDEGKLVQATAEDLITEAYHALAKMLDATAARDYTNASGTAKADVIVNGQTIIKDAPVSYLLWLEKELEDIRTFVQNIPVHSPTTTWELAEGTRGIYKSAPAKTARQVQQHKVVTLAPATEHHPAQVQLVAEAVTHGIWTRTRFTGAVPVSRREGILSRIAALKTALHVAREQANRVEALTPAVGSQVLNYIFN